MRLQTIVWGSAALLFSSTGLSTAGTSDCPNGFQVIELQPYEVICDGTTSASTRTRQLVLPMLNQEEVNLSLGLILFHSNLWVPILPIKIALLGCLMILGSLRSQVNPGLQRTPTCLFSQIP